jgi:hypothetical protein
MPRFRPITLMISLAALALLLTSTIAEAGLVGPTPVFDSQAQGLSIAAKGVGLLSINSTVSPSSSETITFAGSEIPGPVQHAFLYWAGRDFFCPQDPLVGQTVDNCLVNGLATNDGPDQRLTLNGSPIIGTFLDAEANWGAGDPDNKINNIGYRADVTSLVQSVVGGGGAGPYNFTIADGDTTQNFGRRSDDVGGIDGATLLVIYTDPAETQVFQVQVLDGLDFAHDDAATLESKTTGPVNFNYTPDSNPRSAELVIAAADAEPLREDVIRISDNLDQLDQLDSSDGDEWDTEVFNVDIPAGVGTTTVQLFSEDADGTQGPNNPDSMSWILGALRIPISLLDGGEGCTPGYWKQPQHVDSWIGFTPDQKFSDVFGVPPFSIRDDGKNTINDPTLLQALGANGGGINALARHAIAALLNAASPDVASGLTPAEVISLTQGAITSGDYEGVKDQFEELNEQGCPLS